jgi:hypothetical protein
MGVHGDTTCPTERVEFHSGVRRIVSEWAEFSEAWFDCRDIQLFIRFA